LVILDRQSAIARKGVAGLLQFPRTLILLFSRPGDYLDNPPILVNSFPKSGTHLLLQMIRAMPGCRYFGGFIASTPSITMKERNQLSYHQAIDRIVPGEVIPAHLYCRSGIEKRLQQKNVVHYFIYRDPRDVVVSEAMYLTYMTRFHRLHPYFKRLPCDEDRISASILGLKELPPKVEYPDVASRFSLYRGWLGSRSVHPVMYEDLMGDTKLEVLHGLVNHYNERARHKLPVDETVQAMLSAIDPSKSHTFRRGKVGGWRDHFTSEHFDLMKEFAGSLLIDFGYEADDNWR
jgi:hypothetical protein